MEELKTFLIKAKDEYYKGNPIIPDEVYDRLEEQLDIKNLSVGTMSGDDGFRYPHMFPMYSLQKIYEGEKDPHKVYKEWAEVTPKLDGAAVSLLYVEG